MLISMFSAHVAADITYNDNVLIFRMEDDHSTLTRSASKLARIDGDLACRWRMLRG